MIEQPVMMKICGIWEESPGVKTFFFKSQLRFEPGQFVMVWIPLLDEKPLTISYIQDGCIGISVLKRGVFTTALHNRKVGDMIGVRGPYGRGFGLQTDSEVCVVGGGIGMASLSMVIERSKRVTIIQGARTSVELLYQKRFKGMHVCTDDGSSGFKGTAVDLFAERLKKQQFRKVYTCGPERMMVKVVELCKKYTIECEVSLERYMKCGFGVCGQCDCSGQLVCIDGPVFKLQELAAMKDFGRVTLLKTGERIFVNH